MRTESFDSERGSLFDRLIYRMRVAKILRYIPKDATRITDLGCGKAAPLLRMLLDVHEQLIGTGVDLAPDQTLASERLTLITGDLNAPLTVPSNREDVVLSLAVIEHLDDPDTHLREIFRILAPNGLLLLTTPSPRGKPVLEFLAFRLKLIAREEIEDHKRYFDTAMLRAALVHAGFDQSYLDVRTFQFGMNNLVLARKGQ